MAASRRTYSTGTKTRKRLVEAASDLLEEEGHPAMTVRRVAARAKVKPQLVHYYFRSMEELMVTVFEHSCANYGRLHEEALAAPNPLRAIWQLNSHLPEAKRMFEYVALGRRYPALRIEMRRSGEEFRKLQVEAIARAYAKRGIVDPIFSPDAFAMLMSAVARSIVIEGQVGLSASHEEIEEVLERWIAIFDPGNPQSPRSRAASPQLYS